MDVSPSMVAKAQKNMANAGLSDIIEIKEGKAIHIPFADNSFDTVVSTGSIHHWKNPIASLNEVYRVLKHGGYALMYDVMSDTPSSVLKETAHEFGRLKMLLLWLHAFEEPFYRRKDFELLAQANEIGTLWNGMLKWAFEDILPDLKKRIGIPDDHMIGYIMVFGKPAVKYARTVEKEKPLIKYISEEI